MLFLLHTCVLCHLHAWYWLVYLAKRGVRESCLWYDLKALFQFSGLLGMDHTWNNNGSTVSCYANEPVETTTSTSISDGQCDPRPMEDPSLFTERLVRFLKAESLSKIRVHKDITFNALMGFLCSQSQYCTEEDHLLSGWRIPHQENVWARCSKTIRSWPCNNSGSFLQTTVISTTHHLCHNHRLVLFSILGC